MLILHQAYGRPFKGRAAFLTSSSAMTSLTAQGNSDVPLAKRLFRSGLHITENSLTHISPATVVFSPRRYPFENFERGLTASGNIIPTYLHNLDRFCFTACDCSL